MTTLTTRVYLMVVLCIGFLNLYAQDYSVNAELISTDAGLSGVTTYSIKKDQTGFVWISTSNGLDRYDGATFQYYNKDVYHYSDDVIGHLVRNKDHELWLIGLHSISNRQLHIDKVSIFDTQTKKAFPKSRVDTIQQFFRAKDYDLVKSASNITQIFFTNQQGELWTYQSGQFLQIPIKCPSAVKRISRFNEGYRLAAHNEILTFDQHWTLLSRVQLPGPILDIWINEQGTTWVSTKTVGHEEEYQIWELSELLAYQPYFLKDEAGNRIKLEFTIQEGCYIYRSKAGFWILNLKNKLLVFDPEGNQMEINDKLLGFKNSIRFNDLVETEDLILVATNMGIVKLKINTEKFKTLYTKDKLSDSRGIVEMADGTILFSEGKLYSISGNNQQISCIYPETTGFGMYYADSLLLVGNGYNVNYSVFVKNFKTGEIDYYPPFDESIVYSIVPTSIPNQFWVGCKDGIGLLDLKQKDTIQFEKFNEFSELKKSRVKFIHQNKQGNWLATDKGVFLLDEKKGVLRQFNQASGDLPYNDINHIHEDQQGILWLSTNGAGIIAWNLSSANKPTSSFQQYDVTSGLSHNIVYSIYEDNKNRLWLSSNRGIMCMDKTNAQVKVFLEKDGLPHSEYNLTSHYQAKDSTLYFGSLGGLVAFQPNNLTFSFETETPLTFIASEILNDQEFQIEHLTQQILKNEEISLSRSAFLELEFKLLDYDNSENHQYIYKIDGLKDQWTTTNDNTLRIGSLPYGKYILQIKGRNINAGWSNQVLGLKIMIPRPFYLRSWFFACLIILAGLITWCLFKIRTRQLKKDRTRLAQKVKERTAQIEADKVTIEQQSQKLKALDQLKSRFFTNITHELRTPLSLILAPADQLAQKKDREETEKILVDSIYQNAQRLLGLTDELLDLAKVEAGTLEVKKEMVDINVLFNRILNRFREFAGYQHIDFLTKLTFLEDLVLELDAKKIEKILGNLLSNAFKFTPYNGKVEVNGNWDKDQLILKVSDTGQGIASEELPLIFDRYYQSKESNNHTNIGGAGIGLAICKEYTQVLEGKISVSSKLHQGTTFVVKIPAKSVPSSNVINRASITPIEHSKPNTITPKALPLKEIQKERNRILIVEDNFELGHYLYQILVDTYQVELAYNGKEAWHLIQQYPFDLIISDLMMPEMDGLELLTKIKAAADHQKLPFLMLTALSGPNEKIKALRLGVDDYLQKPFVVEELKIRIENLLKRYQIRKASGNDDIPTADEVWLQKLEDFTKSSISNPSFTVRQLAMAMNISERNLFNKIGALVGVSPGVYLREVRLNQARLLLEQKSYKTVSEVCYAVGFQKPSYFTQLFKKRFGHLPSQYFK